ncbi:MAG: hypothetical protein KA536_11400 [Saprospiraceae bacterium]|nr:hypothetical protein [Saprospiraceae bacterium]
MNHKSIDINQRIPLDTLYAALESYLNGTYSDDYILEQLRLEFKGENRLKKSLRIVNKIILRSPLLEFIEENKQSLKQAIKKKYDRNVILIALLNSSFAFSFDTLRFLGKYLSVQDLVNRETIKKSLANVYGGNRATENAIDSVIPMFIEAGFIVRPALGVYQRNADLQISSLITKQIFTESFKENNPLDGIQEYQLRDPYFLFINN